MFEGGRSDVGEEVEWQELQGGVYEVKYKHWEAQAMVALGPYAAM